MTTTETTERPFWLTGSCPPWCEDTARHEARDLPGDRYHHGPWRQTPLTLHPTTAPRSNQPTFLAQALRQGVRETEPHVFLHLYGRLSASGVDLDECPSMTLDEFEQFCRTGLGLVEQARRQAGQLDE